MLLIEKKTGHGMGKINAPGGKWDIGESLMACARREMLEETGIDAQPLGCAAELRFVERDGPEWLGYVFVARQFSGAMTETLRPDRFGAMWKAFPTIKCGQMMQSGCPRCWSTASSVINRTLPRWCMTSCFTGGKLLEHGPSHQSGLSLSIHARQEWVEE